ncbi:MAG: glucosamine-6-phosphate deaminase [Mollicutes bacterium]|nr:glucosamine-6-phosphate deaminase [bacterium]MDD6801158.1 glucosamine-6-phosphate deaminase [Mollicutes bacterium]MDD7064558.1 glucosamine-6-phosphate deaminase [Mollicutes bacterium]MDY5298300.1 glucosamine-6-phosphate deaminase [Candidatus Enteromonas sp.]
MKIFIFESKEELGKALGHEFTELVKENPHAILGLATGSSPLETYQAIAEEAKEEGISFAEVQSFNLDEYLSCPLEDQTYRYFMNENLFSKIDIQAKNTHFPSVSELGGYDKEIEEAGGVDFQLLGIGRNGHIGFNEPGTDFHSLTHVVDLTDSTREANARFFHNDKNLVPTQAVTMGIGTIKKSRRIALIANGVDKAEAIAKLYREEEDPSFPATALVHHPHFEVYVTAEVDEAAQALLK